MATFFMEFHDGMDSSVAPITLLKIHRCELKSQILIDRMTGTDKNTTKIRFYLLYVFTLNLLSITIKQNKQKNVSKVTKNV